jgi:hypothetical protein
MADNKVRLYYGAVGDATDDNATYTYWISDAELAVVINHLEAVDKKNPKFRKPADIFKDM